ncbi:DUF6199 family natural product biosynthesis protein [Streptomyces alboniger]|uniref:DUF6199 domain-containing protein n=1 Tax=Streptomyces alboniger TaxID=132473 RepID=A0A5J6HEL3_STRAD|nr:DUF6199 family natural product biosynthesis protein [Streptomyces alboniger]QEV18018.1 hypothetical protein CP975_11325 [Streptomyces alboniger]
MLVAFLCVFIVVAAVQVVKPRLLWKANRPLQKPFVKDYEATEPNRSGYRIERAMGVLVLVGAVVMLVVELT